MSRLPLARAYRPQRFSEVLGQTAPIRALEAAAAKGNVASAYIFSGTRGIGKTTIARIFAKALNCAAEAASDCCDACAACEEIREGKSLDVLELDAATHTGIDDVRELREAAQYPPGQRRFRVFILDEAHQLSQSAWNGLLKILEEPPPWCVFLFCTTEPHKIPATIESRALHFAFRSPSDSQLGEYLAGIARKAEIPIQPEALEILVKAADGSVRDGLSALDQVHAVCQGEVTASAVRDALGLVPGEKIRGYLAALGEGRDADALAIVEQLDAEGQDLRAFAAELLEAVRRVAVASRVKSGKGEEWIGRLADEIPLEPLLWMGRILDETELRLRQGGPSRALLDLATLRLGAAARLKALDGLVQALGDGGGSGGDSSGRRPAGARSSHPGGGADRGAARAAPAGPAGGGSGRTRSSDSAARSVAGAPAAGSGPEPRPRSEEAASPASGGGTLISRLTDSLREEFPLLAAALGRAESVELAGDAELAIRLPADVNGMWRARLSSAESQEQIAGIAARLLGRPIEKVGVEQAAASGQQEVRRGPSRQELQEAVRRDPLVRSLFEKFGAVVVSSKPLPQERRSGPSTRR